MTFLASIALISPNQSPVFSLYFMYVGVWYQWN